MAEPPLSELDVDSINNVYIFLADALRHDELPDEIAKRGVYFKTVAHALTTQQSLPTISSGRLPQNTAGLGSTIQFQMTSPHSLILRISIQGTQKSTGWAVHSMMYWANRINSIMKQRRNLSLFLSMIMVVMLHILKNQVRIRQRCSDR